MTPCSLSNVECPKYYMPPCYAVNTHTHKSTSMHILSSTMKMHSGVTCWNWALEGDTSKSPSNANTCKADTFHKSPEEAELVCVCFCVWVCVFPYVGVCACCLCAPESSSVILLQEVTSIYLSYIVTSPQHTHTYCSAMQVIAIHSSYTRTASSKPEGLVQHYD